MHFNNYYQISSNKRLGGARGHLSSFPVGVQAYLICSIAWFTDRVINKVEIEKSFPCIRTVQESDGGGEGAVI